MASLKGNHGYLLGENIFLFCAEQLTLGLNERIHSIEMPATKLYLEMPAAVLEILLENYI
jgi:hypothetical protein